MLENNGDEIKAFIFSLEICYSMVKGQGDDVFTYMGDQGWTFCSGITSCDGYKTCSLPVFHSDSSLSMPTKGSYTWKPTLQLYAVDYYHLAPFCNGIIWHHYKLS